VPPIRTRDLECDVLYRTAAARGRLANRGVSRILVSDADCVGFLQWALPQLGLRWPGFRRNKRQVCRRIEHRRGELGLADLASYRGYLADHPDEWTTLASLCRVTISRFARDYHVWAALVADVLPRLARDATTATVHAWSAGCGAGEEPYTLAIAPG
jgi:chemotaxis protein methyltransferase CheR